MSALQSFRSAFNGFNREDVVHYLEYLNAKHANQINQLTAENEALRQQAASLPELEGQQLLAAELEEKCTELNRLLEAAQSRAGETERQLEAAQSHISELERQLEAAQSHAAELERAARKEQPVEAPVQEPALSSMAVDELEAYRRAERIEREARERAELVYFQANSVLTEAGAKVDGISADITEMADKVMTQLTQLQVAVSSSKQALQDASSIMNAIRPNK